MKKASKYYTILLLLAFLSCKENPVNTGLTDEERKLVDSIYGANITAIRSKLDMQCDSIRQSIFEELVDSIMEIRLIEVEQIINERSK